jgi:hypothetical protein
MRLPVLLSLVALLPGCTSMSTQMADDEGDVIKCEARGFGLIGAAYVVVKNHLCVEKEKSAGFHELKKPVAKPGAVVAGQTAPAESLVPFE